MANEITLNQYLSCTNGNFTTTWNPGQISITQSAIGAQSGVVVVGTSEEDLSVGDVSTPGILLLRNLDSTNYVDYGPKSGGSMVAFGRLKAGEVAQVRVGSSVTLRWVANTASVKVQVLLLEA